MSRPKQLSTPRTELVFDALRVDGAKLERRVCLEAGEPAAVADYLSGLLALPKDARVVAIGYETRLYFEKGATPKTP
jgi:hypothetical protein